MIDSDPGPIVARREPSAWTTSLVVLIVIVLGFGLVAQLIGIITAFAFHGGSLMQFAEDLQDPVGKEGMKTSMWIAQGISTALGLAILPALFWWTMRRRSVLTFFKERRVTLVQILYVIGIMFFFTAVISVVVEWNSNLQYPGGFGVWAREIEDKAEQLTKFLTSFTSFNEYLVAVMIIGVFAAVGEELAFRGLLQTELHKALRNHHAAIWISAIFFSALHLQFYGFFPRVLLGALFGYLYYWSGNLIVPMLAHFLNNFFAVTVLYLGMENIEEPTVAPWYVVLISLVICAALLYRFRAIYNVPPSNDQPA